MTVGRMTLLALALVLSAVAGFRASKRGGIQPGYFEKQEAPAYGVSKEKAMGSELGTGYEEHFRRLYESR
ncbi:MAG TPA: hypothetical protein VFL83_04595 [Anaeromyxobacter sp.]|nr:hypothetical protein [Anaeromyxobacter sp.]